MIFVRPLTDRLVRDPQTREPLPSKGALVERTPYWMRRRLMGDVEIVVGKTPSKGGTPSDDTGTAS